jgi:hypothetical protein
MAKNAKHFLVYTRYAAGALKQMIFSAQGCAIFATAMTTLALTKRAAATNFQDSVQILL